MAGLRFTDGDRAEIARILLVNLQVPKLVCSTCLL
jgi:hypothetical protein